MGEGRTIFIPRLNPSRPAPRPRSGHAPKKPRPTPRPTPRPRPRTTPPAVRPAGSRTFIIPRLSAAKPSTARPAIARPRPKKLKLSKPKSIKANTKTVRLNRGRLVFNGGYTYEIGTPISLAGHGYFLNLLFRYNLMKFGHLWGLNFTHTFPKIKAVVAGDEDTNVNGQSLTATLFFGMEKIKSGRLTSGSTYHLGLGRHGHDAYTRYPHGDRVDMPAHKELGFTIGTRYHADVRIMDWLGLGGFFFLGYHDAKGEDFDRLSLALGLNLKFSLGVMKEKQYPVGGKGKPSNLFFAHVLAGKLVGAVQSYFTGRLNDNYEQIVNSGIISGGDEPGGLADLVLLKSLTSIAGMMSQGNSMDYFLAMGDWRRWGVLAAEALVGAGFMASKGTAGRTTGFANLSNALRMALFNTLSTEGKRKYLSEKQLHRKFQLAFGLGGALNVLLALGSTISLARGKNDSYAMATLGGSTVSQGGSVFMGAPGIKTSFGVNYAVMYHYGGKDGSGWLGGIIMDKQFRGTHMGAQIIIASPMLRGDNIYRKMTPGEPYNGTLLPSYACAAFGYNNTFGKYFSLFGGAEQCIRHGGSDLKVGSLGLRVSAQGEYPIYKGWKVVGGASLAIGWTFGNSTGSEDPDRKSNGFFLNVAPTAGLKYEF